MSKRSLLLVDDESSFRTLVGRELERAGYEIEGAGNLDEARRAMGRRGFDLVLLDVRMPDGSGLELLPEIKEQWPTTEVVMLTAFGTVEEAIRAMKHGAYDFLTKPCKLAELEAILEKALERQQLQRSNTALNLEVARHQPGEGVVGSTPEMEELFNLTARVARTDTTVLIRGESGVGKEVVARAVHRQSLRANQPFIVVDCAALHENLLQSELFGHEKGAYTGAATLKHGLFEVANHGTLFLDEIAELTPGLQVRLLRVLQNHTFRRLGGNTDITVDVRVIAATNRSLEAMIKDSSFREDLFFRLNVVPLHIPPLRQRREDIPPLIEPLLPQVLGGPAPGHARLSRGSPGAEALFLARQRARARKRDRAGTHPVRRRRDQAGAPAHGGPYGAGVRAGVRGHRVANARGTRDALHATRPRALQRAPPERRPHAWNQ